MTTLISPHHSTPKASINAFGVPFLLAPTGKSDQWKMIIHCCRVVNGIKNKNHSPFHGEKPLTIKWILERRLHQISQKRFCMVGTRYFASASNNWYSIWYHNYGRTWSITSLPGLVFRRRRAVFVLLSMPPTSTGAKRWHRLKAVFYVFVFDSTQ